MIKYLFSKYKERFYPVESALLIYLLITLIPAAIAVFSNSNSYSKLIVHLILILFIPSIASFYNINTLSKQWVQTFRVLYPIGLLGFLYTETDLVNNLIFKQNLDPFFASIEEVIFGFQPSLEFSKFNPSNLFAEAMYLGYFAYYVMLIGLPIYWYVKFGIKKAKELIYIIIQSFLLFYLFFIIFPVAGPQYYYTHSDPLPQGYLFGFLIRTIQHFGEAPTAAFPSSHVALCLIMHFMVFKQSKKIFLLILPITILLILSTVYIKAHYAIDIFAAFIAAPIVYKLSLHLLQKSYTVYGNRNY